MRAAPHIPAGAAVALITLVAFVPTFARALEQPAEPPVPTSADTPAGRQFAAWLTVFNGGDCAALRRFLADQLAPPPNGPLPIDPITDRQFGMFASTGGFDVRRVLAPAPDRVVASVQTRRTGSWMSIGLRVAPEPPHKVLGFGFQNIVAPPELLPKQKLTEEEIRRNVDALVTKLVDADQFSGVILVAKDGKTLYKRAAGVASRTWNAPNRLDTKFNVASIGKMFTAVAVAQLVERGKLSYDDTLAAAFPSYPDAEIAKKVTVRHLLTHTSGITGAGATPADLDATFRKGYRRVKDYLPTQPAQSLKFEPGTKLEYSSYGYVLIGGVIQHTSGQDYYDYVRDNVFRPAGMTDPDNYDLDTDPPNLATGYMDAPGRTRRSNLFLMPVKGIPGELGYSTASDLVKFAQALRAGLLVKAESLEALWSMGTLPYTEPDGRYGGGFIVTQYNGTRIVGHGDGWFGITNKFDAYTDLGYTVVILNNIDSDPNSIAYRLREWLTQGTGMDE